MLHLLDLRIICHVCDRLYGCFQHEACFGIFCAFKLQFSGNDFQSKAPDSSYLFGEIPADFFFKLYFFMSHPILIWPQLL